MREYSKKRARRESGAVRPMLVLTICASPFRMLQNVMFRKKEVEFETLCWEYAFSLIPRETGFLNRKVTFTKHHLSQKFGRSRDFPLFEICKIVRETEKIDVNYSQRQFLGDSRSRGGCRKCENEGA